MTRNEQVLEYLVTLIDSKCVELTLKSFSTNDFILREDAYQNILDSINNHKYPHKYLAHEHYVLKRTKEKEYDEIYLNHLETIIKNMLKEN